MCTGHSEEPSIVRFTGRTPGGTGNSTLSFAETSGSAAVSTTKPQPPVRSATQGRRYSVKPGVRFEQMQAALAADLQASEAGTPVIHAGSSDTASKPRKRPAPNALTVNVGDVDLNMVLETENKRADTTSRRGTNASPTSSSSSAGAVALGARRQRLKELSSAKSLQLLAAKRTPPRTHGRVAKQMQQVSRIALATVTSDPVLMNRQYDEQFLHPMNSGPAHHARVAAATATFDRMDRNMNGQLTKGDLRRVLEQDREQHLTAAGPQDSVQSGTEPDDDAAAAAAAGLLTGTRPSPGPKRMKKPQKMKKAGQAQTKDLLGGNSRKFDAEPFISQSSAGPATRSAVKFANSVSEDLSEREVRKLALRAMQAMQIEVTLRTEAQAKLLLDWAGSVPFFRDNAPSEDAMSEISKEVTAQTYIEGDNIITQGEVGDAFYVILSGEVDVLVDGANVGHMTVPSSFGDKALEGDDVRKASIRASTGVTVARLSRESYHASIDRVTEAAEATARAAESHENAALEESIRMADYAAALVTMTLPLERRSKVQNRNLEEWVGTVNYFKVNARTEQHRIEIAKSLQVVHFNDHEEVFKQGDIGDAFYCIMQGEVDIVVDGNSVGTLGRGKCFGDRALEASLTEGGEPDKRAATIRAIGDITLARLSADHYHACIDRVMMAASATPRAANRAETDLEVLAKAAAEHPLSVISGLAKEERIALDRCETFTGSRVIIAQSWVTQAIVRRRRAGGLDVDAPTLSTGIFRNFQCANDAYFQCKKIVDTPFPYPYAQSMLLMLCLYTLIAPVMICQIVNSTPWALVTSFITVGIFVAMNEVARGLEEPFGSGDDSNKIAVDALHMDFNENLWCLTQKSYQR
jgi:CRP-like cAMP-binding protein